VKQNQPVAPINQLQVHKAYFAALSVRQAHVNRSTAS